MNREYNPRSTAPKPYRCALDTGERIVNAIYQVIDRSDGDHVVDTFRNRFLAEKLAATSPVYEVREYLLNMRD